MKINRSSCCKKCLALRDYRGAFILQAHNLRAARSPRTLTASVSTHLVMLHKTTRSYL